MGIAVVLILVLYVLIWLRIRGNIRASDRWYPTFTIRRREHAPQTSSMANQVLWYPIVYSALMAPLFAVRVAQLLGDAVSWQALDATTVVFLLSGRPPPVRFTRYPTDLLHRTCKCHSLHFHQALLYPPTLYESSRAQPLD